MIISFLKKMYQNLNKYKMNIIYMIFINSTLKISLKIQNKY